MSMIQTLKDNPLTSFISVATTIATIIGAFLMVDGRYAHSDELSKLKEEQQQVIRQNRVDLQQSSLHIRKQLIEDKVFELELIPDTKRSQYDAARLSKYKRDLDDIDTSLRQNGAFVVRKQ